MAVFTDALRRRWSLTVDVPGIERVRELCGFDLLAEDAVARLEGSDPVLLGDIVGVLLEPELTRIGCPLREFLRGFVREAMADAAAALLAALVEFYPPRATEGHSSAAGGSGRDDVDLLELCYRLAGAVGIWPGRGVTARKLVWLHTGRKQCGELSSVLAEIFGEETISTTDPRFLM